MLPERNHHRDEVLHGGGLHGGLHVPDLLLPLCPGGVMEAEDIASYAAHLGGVLGCGGFHGGHHGV